MTTARTSCDPGIGSFSGLWESNLSSSLIVSAPAVGSGDEQHVIDAQTMEGELKGPDDRFPVEFEAGQ